MIYRPRPRRTRVAANEVSTMTEDAAEAQDADARLEGFRGAAGHSREVSTTIWCAGCGTWFGGRWWATIDTSTDGALLEGLLEHGFGGINRNHCPSCSASYVVQEPLVVHRPADEQLLIVVPNRRMHRAQHARAALIAAVADDPGTVAPAYAREPILVSGVSGLRGLVGEVTRVSGRPASAPPVQPRPVTETAPSTDRIETSPRSRTETVSAEPRRAAAEPAGNVTAEVEPLVVTEEAPSDGSTNGEAAAARGGLLAALMADASTDGEPGEDRTGPWHDAWALDGGEPPVEHEPTRVSRMVAPRARLPEGRTTRLVLDDGDAIALFRVPNAEAADAALTDDTELRFQLHQTAEGPAMCLTLVPGADVADVCWVFDTGADAALLDQLERRFAVAVEAVDGEGALVGRRVFDPPLAPNVASARERVERAGGSPPAAQALLARGDVDRVGQLRHNFTEHAFAGSRSAADAHLALGILAFWTEPEREVYLLDVQSFPRVWFDAIVRRVLAAALDFGLMPASHLEQRAIVLGLAPDARALLGRVLGAFAELNLSTSLRTNDLDPIDNYENWERLLTRAEALGLAVDAGLRGLALTAMEDARRAADVLDGSEAPIELDPDEDVIELESVDEVFEASGAPVDVTEPLGDLIDTALVGLLDDPVRRVSAAAVLMQRGETEHTSALAEALLTMGADELLRVLPLGVAHVDALAGELVPALRSANTAVRRAMTLFLAEGRRPEAILALVDQLLDARDAGWEPLATALAGYGADVRHLVAGMPLDGEGLERVARVLAAMPATLRETVYDAGARRTTPVQRCLERAARLADAGAGRAGFAHRLDVAVSMLAVGDTTGPTHALSGGGDGGGRFR